MLMFAYGSNLNVKMMERRCPRAKMLGKFTLSDARLVFRGVADVIYEPGAKCIGGLWRISKECEAELDRYEGVRNGLYRKEYFDLEGKTSGENRVLIYQMNSTGIFPPSQQYLECIERGYRDFKLPLKHLRDAVAASYDGKAPTILERQRRERTNFPALAPRPQNSNKIAQIEHDSQNELWPISAPPGRR